MSTGGIGVTVGSNSTKTTDTGQSISNVGSTVGSVQGNISMTAGEDLAVKGSDVLAGKDISLTGQNVAIVAAENQSSQTHIVEQKSSGLTLALSGAVGSALNTAVTAAKDASEESNGRLAALKGVKAALGGVQAVQAGQLVQAQGGDSASMFGVSISLGAQKSSSQQQQEQTSVTGSTLTAGNNLTINATGDGNPANSGDIVVQGSQLKAGGDTTLDAARDVLLLGAASTQKTDGSNRSSGGSVGVSVGIGGSGGGLSIFANANKGQGKEHGDGTFWTEAQIDTGGTLSLSSGRDTALVGAQANGETVKMDVGRDLLLQSQQDSDNYDSKQTSVSGGISVAVIGAGSSANLSMSRDKLHSNYDSVQEQSGIFAGKGGFDITVGEHTQLDGAVIASTADKSKNSLDTGTLGFSNIENKADFKAEHQGGSLSTGGPVGSDLLSNLGSVVLSGLGNNGHAEGTTQAAIADGTITIRDTDKQQQNVDDLSRDTDNANGSIGPIFDKEKEQNRLKEAQLIGEIGGQAMDIARTQGDILGLETALKANPALKGDAEALRETKEYKAEMKKYGTGSALQQGLQAATAAIQGLAGGDMAKALAGASAPYLAEVIHNMTLDPTRKGGVNTEANLMAHAVLGAVVAQVNGNSALAGASGSVMGEYIAQQMYPGIAREDLTEEQRQTLSALGTLAAGLAGGLAGGSTADTVAGAQAGKNAVENNALSDIAENQASGMSQAERYQKAQNALVKATEEFKENNCAGLSSEACGAKMDARRDELLAGAAEFGSDFIPVYGDIKSFAEADSTLGYLAAVVGILPGLGDVVGKAIKGAEKALKAGDLETASKLINKASDEIAAVSGSKGNWSKELNNPQPNKTYQLDGNKTFKTDSLGRTESVESSLSWSKNDRNTYQQCKTGKCGVDGDEGGHLIASIFNGPGEKLNLVPMDGNLNKSVWKQMENKWADALKDGRQVNVKIEPVYTGNSKRPDSFNVTYSIDGGRPVIRDISNSPGGVK
ncbi:hemagglutinin repeat-containing protein [Yersinia massiliensis]|uniref:hemagglutinin repeat-containing protein n=1 Tax=Yersinia massiliensis TaxID=419257 RepID=UPI003703F3DA